MLNKILDWVQLLTACAMLGLMLAVLAQGIYVLAK
jgi:hypothetical protein